MSLIIASNLDVAALNIAKHLIEDYHFEKQDSIMFGNQYYAKSLNDGETLKLCFIDEESVNSQSIQFPPDTRLVIFISRHKSESGRPTLSVHVPGNIGEQSLGGLPRKVSIAPASAMKEALKAMKEAHEEADLGYEVSYECTHHGPSLDIPTLFVELGSTMREWTSSEAAAIVAKGAIAAASNRNISPTVVGIGGPHYNMKFTRMALETETAFGHIIPKYMVKVLDKDILMHCIQRNLEPVKKILLDWKGIEGKDKERLMRLVSDTNLEVQKV
ncbi:MAG: D-aminoacyl-tRNA deacylase [Nitrososphaerota archaeon]|nr:hypothetical protein [Candidatus Bathyarchaeota archaeon]MDW8048772.1 D-aminoacyl-tRNA deacylase [Nitrososphaerota archaeon]